MTTSDNGAAQLRSRQQMILLFILFLGPVVAALLFYFVIPQWQPEHKTNYGVLINPARPLPALHLLTEEGEQAQPQALYGRWSYLYLGSERCDDACARKLYQIRQIRILLNEKQPRVQRVYVAPTVQAAQAAHQRLAAEHPDLHYLVDADGALRDFLKAEDPQALYLTDPLGNWLMVYPGASDSPGILKDIKKLLRMSQIG